jgi:ABC-type branched-subunit amino acid transport system ATPase component
VQLSVSDISKSFAGTVAVDGVSLSFPAGSITTIVGPNGSGKTSLFNIISGLVTPDHGSVFLGPENIIGQPAYSIALKGLGRLFQHPRIFVGLSVFDNLRVAADPTEGEFPIRALLNIRNVLKQNREISEQVKATASGLGLTHLLNNDPSSLSYGQMKMLAIGQLLMRRSAVLLLDEFTAGLDDKVLPGLLKILMNVREEKRTIVMIEHRWELTTEISDSIALLNSGKLVDHGPVPEMVKILKDYENKW